jgi:hypothetical protein
MASRSTPPVIFFVTISDEYDVWPPQLGSNCLAVEGAFERPAGGAHWTTLSHVVNEQEWGTALDSSANL